MRASVTLVSIALSFCLVACGPPAKPTITYPPPPADYKEGDARWQCWELHGKKECGYQCVEAHGEIACAKDPKHNCVESVGEVRCGLHCREDVGEIVCEGDE